jgi:mevalonate pyrophosphate decarboxylase
MKYAAILLILLLVPAAIGCGSSAPAAQAITPAIAQEISAHDKQVEMDESAQGGADRRPIQ